MRAVYLPRLMWTTASIDVFLDERCVLRTGGQAKLTGGHSATFDDDAGAHQAELSWGKSSGFQFPYRLLIDGVPVDEGRVKVENWYMLLIPAGVIGLVAGIISFYFVFRLMRSLAGAGDAQ